MTPHWRYAILAVVLVASCDNSDEVMTFDDWCQVLANHWCAGWDGTDVECTPEERMPTEDCLRREWDCLRPPTFGEGRTCLARQEWGEYDFSIPECDRIRACDRGFAD